MGEVVNLFQSQAGIRKARTKAQIVRLFQKQAEIVGMSYDFIYLESRIDKAKKDIETLPPDSQQWLCARAAMKGYMKVRNIRWLEGYMLSNAL